MQRSDYIYMIIDNLMVFEIDLPGDLPVDQLSNHLNKFDDRALKIIAGFNKKFLEHFLIISKGKPQKDLDNILIKMELVSFMVGPTGNLNFLSPTQIEYILTKIDGLKLKEITEEEISKLSYEQLQNEFVGEYDKGQALEDQLASAAFYLLNQGYSKDEVEEKLLEVRNDPSKLDELFSLPKREIYSTPPDLQEGISSSRSTRPKDLSIDRSEDIQDAIENHINSIHQDISEERATKVNEIIRNIKEHVRDKMTIQYERVLKQIHPDRLNLAFKILKQTKRKSRRTTLLLEWFFCSHLLSSIELKIEHWQVSSQAIRGQAGVYTAGIDFSRYDKIIIEFKDIKLAKVINLARRILQRPTKRAIQKLGQDLVAETGFDEHLYFTD
ncbi:MAG: hypothetical protein EU529_03530 [Promethearchaeota archaeon]|nr:MAG: hypothetical protein EU529_03530 [Candidatus Lokiarchaeota archaeon]